MVVNISMIALVTVVVASCTGGNYGCAGLLPRCHDEERRALLEMKKYALVNYYYSSVLGDWPGVAGGEDCCQWSGITCNNHTGRVIRIDVLPILDISHPNLASTLAQFKELESLDLGWSTIGGTLPNLVCNFKHLKQLHLYGSVNSLSWSLPSCLENLNNLELSLSGIDEYTFPEGLCNMRTLIGLGITGNRINGTIPSCLGNLHNLERLHLGGNHKIGGTIPESLCNLRHLKELDLGWNLLEGPIPSCLGNLDSLERLDLMGNRKINGTIPEGLCNLRHLKQLYLYGNHLNGSIPSCLGNLHNLEVLDLGNNEFQGSIPPSIFPNLTRLRSVVIRGGRLEGTFSFSAFTNLSNLEVIDIRSSKYGLEIEILESPSWVPSFQLKYLHISGCSVVNKGNGGGGNRFPAGFISTQTRLDTLDLEDNQMTGTLPLWVLCNISSLSDPSLRGNKLDGTFHLAPSCNASWDLSYIDLSHNLLHGSLPTDLGLFFPNLNYLFMAGNQLEGPIPPSLGQATHLYGLDLSENQLSGELPHTLTRNQTTLEYLNVSYNRLVGEMLPKDTYMPGLKFLYLHHNSFTGSIPPTVSNFSLLRALDVGHNHLECSLPHCLPSLPSMIALSLTNNHLQGHLPTHHLCQMQHLHLLDLSGNNLTGKIPPCLTNISMWNHKGTDDNDNWVYTTRDIMGFASKKLLLHYQGVPLNRMAGLDLSSNRLDGAIPREIGELKGLRSLNLSNNRLEGSLPRSIGNMESLESLDLSHNNLNGPIPREMVQLNFLSTFCVAFNHLSGEIPSQGQFSTFSNKSDFEGNPELCGAPLERNCSSDDPTQREADIGEGPSLWDNPILFYEWLVLSFAVGFWGVIATMALNRRWRIKFFTVVDDFLDGYLRRY